MPRRSGRLAHIHHIIAEARLPPPAHVIHSESVELARGLLASAPFICLLGESIFAWDVKACLLSALPRSGSSTERPAFFTQRSRSRLRPEVENLAAIIRRLARTWQDIKDDALANGYEGHSETD